MSYWLPIVAFVVFVLLLIFRRPAVSLLLFFVLFSFGVHLVGSLFIDLRGPVLSLQLVREIGPSRSAGLLAVAYILTLLIPVTALEVAARGGLIRRAIADQPRSESGEAALATAFLWVNTIGLVVVLVELLRGGTIPLFAGVERWVYTEQFAGPIHKWYVEFGNFFAAVLGYFWASPLLSKRPPDRRFFLLGIGFGAYLMLVGNRFSIFYSWGSFFAMPLAAIMIARGVQPGAVGTFSRATRAILLSGAAAGAVFIVVGVFQSLVVTRGFGTDFAAAALQQRTLVETGEMWFAAHERIFVEGGGDPREAREFVFNSPLVPSVRNTSIPYLMWLEAGDYAVTILDAGSGYGGGFPDIAFYLAGARGGWLLLAAMALCQAILLVLFCRAVVARQPILVFLVFYVLYAFLNFNIGAMLNFLVAWTFWVKVAALLGWIVVERYRVLADRGTSLVPEAKRV